MTYDAKNITKNSNLERKINVIILRIYIFKTTRISFRNSVIFAILSIFLKPKCCLFQHPWDDKNLYM